MTKQEARYWIFELEDLSKFGNEQGMTKEETEKQVQELQEGSSQFPYVIIKGITVKPKYKL